MKKHENTPKEPEAPIVLSFSDACLAGSFRPVWKRQNRFPKAAPHCTQGTRQVSA